MVLRPMYSNVVIVITFLISISSLFKLYPGDNHLTIGVMIRLVISEIIHGLQILRYSGKI